MIGAFVDSSSDDDTVVTDEPAINQTVCNTTTSGSPPQSDDNVNEKSSRLKFSKIFVPVNHHEVKVVIRGGEIPAQDPIPGVPAGDSRLSFQSDHSAPNLLAVAPLLNSINGGERAVYEQLAGRTLAVHLDDDFVVHGHEARYSRKPLLNTRMETTGSITNYLKGHSEMAQEILAEQVAKAQAKRIKPEDKKIRQMMEEAERRLAMPPQHASASLHSSKRKRSEDSTGNNPPISKRVSFAEAIPQSAPPQSQWENFHEIIQMSDKGKAFQKKGAPMQKRVESGLAPYIPGPLDPQDSSRASGAEVALRMRQQGAKPISAEMQEATILYRQKNQDAYLKLVTGNVPARDLAIQISENNSVSLPKECCTALSSPVKEFRTLSKPDDLPQPASDASLSHSGSESSIRNRAAAVDTPQSTDLPEHLSSDDDDDDDDVEKADVTPQPFPFLEGNHQAEGRETSVEYSNLMDQVDDQVDAQLRSELEKSDDAKAEIEVGPATANEVVSAANALHAMSQSSIQVNVCSDGSAHASSRIGNASKMMQQTSRHSDVPMMAPPSPSPRQSSKPPSAAGTPNPFRTRKSSSNPINVAGAESLTGIRSTPAPSSSKSVAFSPFRAPCVAAVPMNVDSDEDNNEATEVTPLGAKIERAGATRVSAGAKARGGDDNHDEENIGVCQDDHFLPDSGAPKGTKKAARKLKAAEKVSHGEDVLPFSSIRAKRNANTRQLLNANKTEVPETPQVKKTGNRSLKSSLKKPSRTTADSNLFANQGVVRAEDSETDEGHGKRATRQSTDAYESRTEAPHSSGSARKGSETNSRMKGAATSKHRVDADEAQAFEQDEEYSPSKSHKKGRGRSKAADSADEDVMESGETGGRKFKSTRPTKKTARFNSPTPRTKSTTAKPESEIVLCYNSKQIFLPVEIGDRVVRLFTREDTKLYGKADEFDEFDGPWEVVDIRTRKKEKELVETVLEEGISEEMRREAWQILLTAKIKLCIPEEAEKKDKVEPWIQLSQVLPVLDADGIKEGKLGASGIWIESLDSYKVLKKRLEKAKDTDGKANVIKKKIARSKGEDVESSLGVVNLRKNAFVAVVNRDPNWTQNDEFEVEKIRKKRLRLIWLGSASEEEKDQQDIDKWQEILKHVCLSQHSPRHQNDTNEEQKTGHALRQYVILAQWWVQWAGWPIESSTWEPRSSFNDRGSTMIVDHYNKHLDVFRDTPIKGVTYSLDHLFDHEDEYIDKCRSAMAKYQQEKKFPARLTKPRKKKIDNDPEKKAKEAAAKKKLAEILFSDEADEQLAKVPKDRPRIDDKTSRSPGMSRSEKAIAEAAKKTAVEEDWENDLFGDHIESPAKSQTPNAKVAPMAQMVRAGQGLDVFGEENPSTSSQEREVTYSLPPMSDERISGRAEGFRTYNAPQKKKPEGFHPLYDVAPGTERKEKVISTSEATDDNAPLVRISNTLLKPSASPIIRDGDIAMVEAAHNESISDEAAATEPVVERAQTIEAVEELVVEERLFVQQDPSSRALSSPSNSEMNAQISLGSNREVKLENTQEVFV